MVLRMLEGETVQSEVLPARFIRRDSFGGINDVDGESLNLFDKEHINALFDKIFYRYESEEFYEDIKSIRQIFCQLMESVITSYEMGESSTAQRNEILRDIKRWNMQMWGASLHMWNKCIIGLAKKKKAFIKNHRPVFSLWYTARL